MYLLKRKLIFGVFSAALLAFPQSVNATVGLAEWGVTTANGNIITNSDPYSQKCGVCLMNKKYKTLASHVKWWRYYRKHVTGQASEGYFLLNEHTENIKFFKSESELAFAVASAKIGKPISRPLTSQDGWNATWIPLIRRMRCDQDNVDRELANIRNPSEKEALRQKYKKECQLLKEQERAMLNEQYPKVNY